MLVTRWFILLGSILLPMCSALMLNESKTYALRVPQTGFFTFIICGTGNATELTKICYDGRAKSSEHLTCQKESYCGIQVSQPAGFTQLTAGFGGRIANFNETCVKIKVEKFKQIALNPIEKVTDGTCTWNATDEGKLLVDVTLSKDFTVEVENAVLYEEMKAKEAGLLAEHLHWITPLGIVVGVLVVVAIIVALVYCLYCKKKKQPEVGKQPSLATIPPTKPVGSTTVEINMIEKLMAKEASLTPNAKKSQSNVLVKEQGDAVKRQPSKTNVLCADQPLNAPSFVSTPNVEKCTTSEEKQGVQPEIVKEVCPQIVATPKTPVVEMDKKITTQEVKQEKMPLKTSGAEEGVRNKDGIKMEVKKIAIQKEVEKLVAKTPLIPVGGIKKNDELELKKDGEKTTTEERLGPSKLTKTSTLEGTGRTKTEVEKKATKTTSEDDLRTGRLSNVSTPISKTPRTSVDGNKNKDNVGIKNDAQKTTTEEEPQPGPSKMETKFLIGRDGRKMEVKREVATTQKGIKTREGARTASGSDLEEEETQASEISNVFQRSLKKSMSGESKKKVKSRGSSKKTKSGKSKSKSGKSRNTKSGKSKKSSKSGQSKKAAENERRTRRMNYDSMSAEEEADLRHHLNTNEKFRQAFDKIARDGDSDEPEVKTAEEKKSVVEEFYPGYLSRGLVQPTISTDLIVSRKRRNSDDGGRRTDSTDN